MSNEVKVFHDEQKKDYVYSHLVHRKPTLDAFSMHTHNLYEIIYFIKGDASLIIEDKTYKLKKDDLLLIRPTEYHFIKIDSPLDYERYDILFEPQKLKITNVSSVPETLEVINLETYPVIKDIFNRLDYYHSEFSESDFKDLFSMLLKELFYNLTVSDSPSVRDKTAPKNPNLSKMLKYLNDNIYTVKSVKELADKFFVTESYVFQLFKKELKITPKKYINDKRLLKAQSLILSGVLPTSAYLTVGFNDYAAFYRAYVKFFGCAPSKEKISHE